MVPLRLFLGLTFVYAGLQKVFDPQFFHAGMRGYIGQQITAFASGSPLHGFLINVAAPHALLFGILVVLSEVAIGLCTLLGLCLRPAALVGLLLNLIFFLSADWRIFPYFYGSDIVFLFCWLTLFLAGPANQKLPVLDTHLAARLVERASPAYQRFLSLACLVVLGVRVSISTSSQFRLPSIGQPAKTSGLLSSLPDGRQPKAGLLATYAASGDQTAQAGLTEQGLRQVRRSFLLGAASGGGVTLALVWLIEMLSLNASQSSTGSSAQTQVTPTLGSPTVSSTPGTSNVPGEIARISSVPVNSSFDFTLPAGTFNGDPGILIHLNNGQFVAYDAVCTHAGCPVDYDPGSQHLICPCHGATFDPAKSAAVLDGPAQIPLTSVPIEVDRQTGIITLNQ